MVFSRDDVLDAACEAVSQHGREATMAQISAVSGITTGSIYHRFTSREELFVALWLRSIERFHVNLLASASDVDDPHRALVGAAVSMVRYCRQHPAEAYAMTLYRHARLVVDGPARLRDEIAHLNVDSDAAIARLAALRYPEGPKGSMTAFDLVDTGAVRIPYGLVRPYVGGDVPAWLDDIVRAAVDAVLRLGDG